MKSPAITIASGAAFYNGWHQNRGGLLIIESEAVRYKFEVLAFDETLGTQFIKKGHRRRLVSPRGGHDGKTIDAAWFLRRCLVEWPYSRCRTAEKGDEFPPLHIAESNTLKRV